MAVGRTGPVGEMGNGAGADQVDLRLAVGAVAAWLAVLWGL
ncbi:MAG: hypothetical protein JWN47_87, partial [Frankiales bacterium]|nr:hypothetical protein [Frankiales bacterium]